MVARYFIKKDQLLQNELNQNKNDFMKSAIFEFNFDSIKERKIIAESLTPEIKNKIPKTKCEMKTKDKTIILKVESEDLSSLRAASNSYLRWINTALTVKKQF